jgi:two-component system, NtrC family, response regulator AtoC
VEGIVVAQPEASMLAQSIDLIELDDPIAGMIIGQSPAMQKIITSVHQVASYPKARILIQGDSGTGKDVVAQAIHKAGLSSSSPGSFVAINCAAIPESLMETELFGVEAGAYTDAKVARDGLLARAHRGTLFLDEIGSMPLILQAKLLRFLETWSFRRVGGMKESHVQLRVIAATNVDLQTAVARKEFRDDLFYRLKVVTLFMPPLREHREDIPLLIEHFLQRESSQRGLPLRISDEALNLLLHYNWPGNVRELQHAIELGAILCQDNLIQADDLLSVVSPPQMNVNVQAADLLQKLSLPTEGINLPTFLASIEHAFIQEALKRCGRNQVHAAALLGISRDKLRYRLATKVGHRSSELISTEQE